MYENEIWKPINRLNDLLVRRAYYANYLNNIRMKKIEQYKDNHLIAVYNNIVEASEITGIDDASISKCVNGDLNTAGRFIWKHKTYE